jgi:exopolyphosphatase / guanosine-5'-triphosphate,3'-diphosphate pyrophosphatase
MVRRPGAAIDLGSTSVHLLVARLERSGLATIADESAFLGLGAAVDGTGLLGPAGRTTLAASVLGYVDKARAAGASEPIVMGTEPLRRLQDATRIVAEVSAITGVPLHVLEHAEEALLTLIGLTAGRAIRDELVVVDIGGGSCEIVEIGPGRLARAVGLQVGAGRLTRRLVEHDPPTGDEMRALADATDEAVDWTPSRPPTDVVVVGGTASNLLKLVRRGGDPDRPDTLDRPALALARRVIASGPAELLAAQHGLREARIRLLAAGAAIVEVLMQRCRVDAVRVADAGIREGAIIAAARAGTAWRDRLEELAHGWIA